MQMKLWLEANFPHVVERVSRVRHADTTRILFALPSYPSNRAKHRANGKYLAVDIQGRMGLGGMLTHTARLLKFAEDNRLCPVISFTNPLYADSPGIDWFDRYFQLNPEFVIADRTKSALSFLELSHERSLLGLALPQSIQIREANRLF